MGRKISPLISYHYNAITVGHLTVKNQGVDGIGFYCEERQRQGDYRRTIAALRIIGLPIILKYVCPLLKLYDVFGNNDFTQSELISYLGLNHSDPTQVYGYQQPIVIGYYGMNIIFAVNPADDETLTWEEC